MNSTQGALLGTGTVAAGLMTATSSVDCNILCWLQWQTAFFVHNVQILLCFGRLHFHFVHCFSCCARSFLVWCSLACLLFCIGFLFYLFWWDAQHGPWCAGFRSQTEVKPAPLAMEAQSLNHWTAREVPHLFIFLLLFFGTLCVRSKNTFFKMSRNLFPVFSSRCFIVSGLMFKSLIRFKLVFVSSIRWGFNFIFLHVVIHFSQYHLLKRVSFPH